MKQILISDSMAQNVCGPSSADWDQAFMLARLRPGCLKVVILPAFGPMPFAVVWGKSSIPKVPRRNRDH
jgi:hypothetical protein